MQIILSHNDYHNKHLDIITRFPKLTLNFKFKQFFVSKTDYEAIPHGGFCTWYPFRIRWWPDKSPGWKVGIIVNRHISAL